MFVSTKRVKMSATTHRHTKTASLDRSAGKSVWITRSRAATLLMVLCAVVMIAVALLPDTEIPRELCVSGAIVLLLLFLRQGGKPSRQ